MKKILLYILALGILVLGSIYYYTQRDSRNDIKHAKAEVELSSTDLLSSYENSEEDANSLFLGKTLMVQGILDDISQEGEKVTIKLESDSPLSSVVCEMNTKIRSDFSALNQGQNIQIKGVCSGKLMDIILVNCVIEEK